MTDLPALLQSGASSAWVFIPSAILLGALHGLEPGHSKTMMAAFIIAIRGTVKQAVLLGLAATLSHTLIVWLVALGGLYLGSNWNSATTEPYLQLASGILIIGVALWMLVRTRKEQAQDHGHRHNHHHHGDEVRRINTGHGVVELSIFEENVPPRFRLHFEHAGKAVLPSADEHCLVEIERPDGKKQQFSMISRGEFLESTTEIPEPHEFVVRLSIIHGGHAHNYTETFAEHDHHEGLGAGDDSFQDAHERAHAEDIQRRFHNRNVTTGQIIIFGLTGGLIPCPAAITVLLLCLQLKKVALGAGLVVCFSIGLALTMVASGTLAALSVKYASRKFSGFGQFARRAPYISCVLIFGVGLFIGYEGLRALMK